MGDGARHIEKSYLPESRAAGERRRALGASWLTHLLVACLLYNLLHSNFSKHKMYD